MTSEKTPVSLLACVRDPADQEAWNEFDARYRELILRHCRRRGLQTADAEDVRQLVMLSLTKALRSFRYDASAGSFRGYLGRSVHHAILRAASRQERGGSLLESEELEQLASGGSEVDDSWETDWMHHHLRLAMETVGKSTEPATLETFQRLLAGESIAAVAQASGKSVEAVQKILQRMRDRMHEQVARQIAEEEPGGPGA